MAIAAGRRLSDRLFGGLEGAKADYNNVPVRLCIVAAPLSQFKLTLSAVCCISAQEKA